MKKVGVILKEEREKQGLTIEEIADRTKIHPRKIEALEQGDYSLLPAKVFAKGLIRSYGSILKLDPQWIQELCDAEFEEPKPIPPPQPQPVVEAPQEELETAPSEPTDIKKPLIALSAVLFGLFIIYVLYTVVVKINSYKEEEVVPSVIETPKEDPQPAEEPSDEKSQPEENNENVSAASGEEKSKEKKAPVERKKEEKPKVQTKIEKAKPKPKAKPQDTTPKKTEGPRVVPIKDEAPSNTELPKVKPVKVYANNKLVITAMDSVRVEILWSDGKPQVMLLKAQEKKTLVFSNPLTVRVNNGGAVRIQFNQKDRGIPGPLNQPIELTYP